MTSRLRSTRLARTAVALVGVALPLIAAGSAQAAIAGANPSAFTNRPNVVSATTLGDGNSVSVCFDKTIVNQGITAGNVQVGGYRAGNLQSSFQSAFDTSSGAGGKCLIANFSNTTAAGELPNYSFVHVAAGAVQNSAFTGAAGQNLDDTVALTGSTSHSGTTGVTVAPNLVGIASPNNNLNQSSNSLTYVFDKDIFTPTTGGTLFWFTDAAGDYCTSGAAPSVTNSTVTVFFGAANCVAPGGGNVTVPSTSAIRGGVNAGSNVTKLAALADPNAPNPGEASAVAGAVGTPAVPFMTGATLNVSQNSVDYTFDAPVNTPNAADFFVGLSNGPAVQAQTTTVNGNVVHATFGGTNLSAQDEYAVTAFTTRTAVKDANANNSLPGAGPVGGNAGAFARGFTTGPDVFAVIANANGTVQVNLDQRVRDLAAVNGPGISIYDRAGNQFGAGTSTSAPSQSAGPQAITLTYNTTDINRLNTGGALAFTQGALQSPLTATVTGADAQSVPQVVKPLSSSVILRAYRANKARHAKRHHVKHHSKKHSKKA